MTPEVIDSVACPVKPNNTITDLTSMSLTTNYLSIVWSDSMKLVGLVLRFVERGCLALALAPSLVVVCRPPLLYHVSWMR